MKKFATDIDLEQNELRNARVENLASAPLSPVVGQMYFDTTEDSLFYWDSAVWIKLEAAPLGGAKSMVVSFASGTDTGLSTSTTGYVRKADMIYAGSLLVGPITAIKATIWKSDIGGASGEIRIINKSNASVICELTGIDNLDTSLVIDLGALSNIPTEATTLEIQMGRSNGASRIIECSSIEIVY